MRLRDSKAASLSRLARACETSGKPATCIQQSASCYSSSLFAALAVGNSRVWGKSDFKLVAQQPQTWAKGAADGLVDAGYRQLGVKVWDTDGGSQVTPHGTLPAASRQLPAVSTVLEVRKWYTWVLSHWARACVQDKYPHLSLATDHPRQQEQASKLWRLLPNYV